MADTKIVSGKGLVSRSKEERDDDDDCPVCLAGEGHGPFWPHFPKTYPDVRTIYVRKHGSDDRGDGSHKHPFRTFQHAIRFVPPEIPPGHQVTVDVTGIGLEAFPTGYALPPIQSSAFIQQVFSPSTQPFATGTPLNIRAMPQPFSAIPVGDTSIPLSDYTLSTVPGSSGLTLLTLTSGARASWANNALQGALLIGDGAAATSCAIYGSTTTTLLLCNTPSQVTGNLTVVEPSAAFQTPTTDADGAGFETVGSTAIAFQGIKFTTLDGSLAFVIGSAPNPSLELCQIEGIETEANIENVFINACVITNGIEFTAGNSIPTNTLFLNLGFTFFGEESFILSRCAAINTQGSFGPSSIVTPNGSSGGTWEFQNVQITDSVAPNGAIYAHGGGGYALNNVEIDGSSADAVFVDGPLDVQLINVGGTGNGGIGVHATNGAQVRVDATTTVTGAGGNVKSGSLVAAAYAALQQYDLVGMNAGATAAHSTGSRIFLA